MTNQFSQARLSVPVVPADFEAQAGSSKADFAKAILALLQGAEILGVNPDDPNNFDLAQIQNRITALETNEGQQRLQQRAVSMNGIANGLMTVPFDDIGTTNYWVNLIFITANIDINTVTWSLIENSKQTNQCQVRIDGDASTYKVEVQIIENKNLTTA